MKLGNDMDIKKLKHKLLEEKYKDSLVFGKRENVFYFYDKSHFYVVNGDFVDYSVFLNSWTWGKFSTRIDNH